MLIVALPPATHEQLSCTITQITANTGVVDNRVPPISADRTHIAFQSGADIIKSNTDGKFEIFLFDTTTSTFTQITTNTRIFNEAPSINADGTRLAFTFNDTGDGTFQIFLFDITTVLNTRITGIPRGGGKVEPSISTDGTRLDFTPSWALPGATLNLIARSSCSIQPPVP
jgi:Tol biopolymer transport system component